MIKETGGSHGVLNPGELEAALSRPLATYEGKNLFSDDLSRVAALIHALATSHPFVDGNKRTALGAGDFVLRLNGKRLIPSDDVEPFFWSIARSEQTPETIKEWLGTRVESWRSPK